VSNASVSSCGYVLTPFGREGIAAPTCECRSKIIHGSFVVCAECGTALGAVPTGGGVRQDWKAVGR
jgi:hypothetical protein